MEKGISYLNRTFGDYRNSLIGFTRQYYPELENEFNDASIGSWLLDVVANVSDNLSFHIDRVYQETNVDSANERASLYALARTNGVKIPGPKASLAEVLFSIELPVANPSAKSELRTPDWSYAPLIRKGTKVAAGNQIFELLYDVNFNEQFNENGISNRTLKPKRNSNGFITRYVVTKTGIVSAGETKVYSKVITDADIVPFMSFMIPDTDVMNVESIIFKDGTNYHSTPTMNEFMMNNEFSTTSNVCGDDDVSIMRYFEVDNLSQQYRWGDEGSVSESYPDDTNPNEDGERQNYCIRKGEWKPLLNKFVTEFTDKGYLRVTFGAGNNITKDSFEKTLDVHEISYLINNDGLGKLPNSNSTMYVLYRRGGGQASNVAQGAITNFKYLIGDFGGSDSSEISNVKRSLSVTNITPSVSGKDMPSVNEIRNIIKYHNAAQGRCVTVKDYHDRLLKMPARYGCPFRVGVTEENNKVMIYTLGLKANGELAPELPDVLSENIQNYLSEYRSLNDYVEIKSGRILNLQFEIDIFVDKSYSVSDVMKDVISKVTDYMDVNKHQMGDDIFIGDIEKEISKVDGVLNLIEVRVYNVCTDGYSSDQTLQQLMVYDDCCSEEELDSGGVEGRYRIDLKASHKMIYSENDTMFEIKYPEKDIICRVIQR